MKRLWEIGKKQRTHEKKRLFHLPKLQGKGESV